MKTGLTPSASGSAYFELEPSSAAGARSPSLRASSSSLKLTCTVHGPRPLPRSAPFTPHILLSTHVKFAPFASRQRRGYIRDSSERDLAVHLETALRGVLIGERWPKSGVDVIITVLEGEEDCWWGDEESQGVVENVTTGGWGMMSLLSACITVASAAIADAGIDCVDLISGGVAAIICEAPNTTDHFGQGPKLDGARFGVDKQVVLDPCPSEHRNVKAACVIGYLQSRDEVTEIWAKGDIPGSSVTASPGQISLETLMDGAVEAAVAARLVLIEAIKESTEFKVQKGQADLQLEVKKITEKV